MAENLFEKNSIRVHSGKYINLLDPDPNTILIEDIAWGLCRQNRFGGHTDTDTPYNVAQHSCFVSYACHKGLELAGLLHNASKAYLGDIPKPFKDLLPEYRVIEDRLMTVIAKKFGFEYPLNEEVKRTDITLLNWEWETLVLKNKPPFILPNFYIWTENYSWIKFIQEFDKLTK